MSKLALALPLACSEHKINECRKLPDILKVLPPLPKDEEYVSYCDVDTLFMNILLKETVDYFIRKIYKEKLLNPICKKLIFK